MTETKSKTSKWVKILLVASLGVNLVVLGLYVGLATRHTPPPNQFRAQETVAFLTFALPDEPRREIRQDLLEHRRELNRQLDMNNGIRRELLRALSDQPFDIDRVAELLGMERDQFVSMGELAHEALLREIGELSEAERDTFVAQVRKRVENVQRRQQRRAPASE